MRDNIKKHFSKSISKRIIALIMAAAMVLGMVYVNNRNGDVKADEPVETRVDTVDATDTSYIGTTLVPEDGKDYTIHVPVKGIKFSLPDLSDSYPDDSDTDTKSLYPIKDGDDVVVSYSTTDPGTGDDPIDVEVTVDTTYRWCDGASSTTEKADGCVALSSPAYFNEIVAYTADLPIEGLDEVNNKIGIALSEDIAVSLTIPEPTGNHITVSGDKLYTKDDTDTEFYYGSTEFLYVFSDKDDIEIKGSEAEITGATTCSSLSGLEAEINKGKNEYDGYYGVYQITKVPVSEDPIYFNGLKTDRDFYINMAADITASYDGATGLTFSDVDPKSGEVTITYTAAEETDWSVSVSHPTGGPSVSPSSATGASAGEEQVIPITPDPAKAKDIAGNIYTYNITVSSGTKEEEKATLTITYDNGVPTLSSFTVNGLDPTTEGIFANKDTSEFPVSAEFTLSGTKSKLESGKLTKGSDQIDLTVGDDNKSLSGSIPKSALSEGKNEFTFEAESNYGIPMDPSVTFKVYYDTKVPVIHDDQIEVSQDDFTTTCDPTECSSTKDTKVKVTIDDLEDASYNSGIDPAKVSFVFGSDTIAYDSYDDTTGEFVFIIPADSDNNGQEVVATINAEDNAGNKAAEKTVTFKFFEEEAEIALKVNNTNPPKDNEFIVWSDATVANHDVVFSYTVKSEVPLKEAKLTYDTSNGPVNVDFSSGLTPAPQPDADGKYVYTLNDASLSNGLSSFIINKATLTVKNDNDYTSTPHETGIINVDVESPTDINVDGIDSDWHKTKVVFFTAKDNTGVSSAISRYTVTTSNCMDESENKTIKLLPDEDITKDYKTAFTVPESKDANGTKISVNVIDNAKNEPLAYSDFVIKVDQTDPKASLKIDSEDASAAKGSYRSKDPRITFTGSDVPSGIRTKDADGNEGVVLTITHGSEKKEVKSDTISGNTANGHTLTEILGTEALSGKYTVELSVADRAVEDGGNKKIVSTSFIMDQLKPVVKINRKTAPTKGISGYFNSNVKLEITVEDDNIPKDTALVVKDNGSVLKPSWSKSGNVWKTTITVTDDGKHTISAEATDLSKNKGKDTNIFTIDRMDPVLITNLNGSEYDGMDDYITGAGIVGVTVEDFTEDGDDMEVTIERYDPVTGMKETEIRNIKKSGGSYPTIDCTENGTYEIIFVATDKCGNAAEKSIGFTVDNAAPKNNMFITTAKPAKFTKYQNAYSNKVGVFGDDKEAYSYGQYYANSVSVDLQVADYNIDSITVTDNGSALSPSWSYSNGVNSATISISSEGYHELKIKSVDKSGNVTDDSGASQKLEFIIDKTAPVISLSLNNAGYSDGSGVRYLTYDGSVEVYVSDTNKDSDDLTRVVLMTPPGSGQSSDTDKVGEGAHAFTTEADYEIHYVAVDRAGNRSAERVVTFRVDKTAPQLTISSSAGGGTATNAVTVTFSMNEAFYNDIRSGEIKVYKKIDGQGESLLETIEFKPRSASDSLSKTYADDGEYRFEFTAQDMAGNVATPAQHTFILDGTAPVITLSGVKNYDITDKNVSLGVTVDEAFYTTNNVVLKGTREDIDGKVENLKFDDVSFNRGKLTNFEKIFKEDGIYDIDITSTDKAGNKDSKSVHFTIDTKAPEIGDLSKYDGTVINKFEWNENLEELIRDLTVCEVTIYLDGVEYDGMSDIEDGTHVLKIVATDEMDHTTTKEYTFLLDTKGPNIIVSGVEEGQKLIESTDVSVSVQLDEDTLDNVQLNGQAIDLADNEAKFTVSKKGSYTLTATAHDEAGNDSSIEMHFNYRGKFNWIPLLIIGGGVLLIALILLLLLRRRKES